MRSYDRALKADGRVVLAEPGAAHEDAQVSVDVMKKYGILEKGMELEDVVGYAAGTALGVAEQAYVVRARSSDINRPLDVSFVQTNGVVTNNLFTLTKGGAAGAGTVPAAGAGSGRGQTTDQIGAAANRARLMSDYRPDAASFGAEYYAASCGQPVLPERAWLAFFGAIADRIVSDIHPRRTARCRVRAGIAGRDASARGVDAEGVESRSYAIRAGTRGCRARTCDRGRLPTSSGVPYDRHRLHRSRRAHAGARTAEAAIANFCRHASDVLFSSSPLDYGETTHVNVRPPEYWAEQFARHGFIRDVDFDASFITPWAVRFRRKRRTNPPGRRRLRTAARSRAAGTRRPARPAGRAGGPS